jgi:hemerythrin
MDGYEATRRIRELEAAWPGHQPIPIVAMTANVFREDIERALTAGMNDHIGKPIDFEEVLEKLRRIFPGSGTDHSRMIRYGEAGADPSEKWKYGLAWSPDLATGNSIIDSQHKQIFRLTSSLSAACMEGRGKTMLGETLDFLVSYTVRHFIDEEALQKEYRYPAYEAHKKMHDDFRETVTALMDTYKRDGSSAELLEKVNTVIVHWLVEHIKQEDAKIAVHIRKNS